MSVQNGWLGLKNALPLQLCEMKVQTLGELRMRDTANCGLGYLL